MKIYLVVDISDAECGHYVDLATLKKAEADELKETEPWRFITEVWEDGRRIK
jgi:hypothetical protein